MTINDLNMTEEQIVNEIQFMRMFDKYLQKMLGMEKYNELCLGFARMMTSAELKSLGATDEEIDECCDHADMLMWLDELNADRKTEPQTETHDIRTDTHECVKDTHDKDEPQTEMPEYAEWKSACEKMTDCSWK